MACCGDITVAVEALLLFENSFPAKDLALDAGVRLGVGFGVEARSACYGK